MQVVIALLASVIAWIGFGLQPALAVLMGGFVVVIPTALFAKLVFSMKTMQSPGRVIARFMMGELGKLVLIAVLFLFVINKFPVSTVALLMGMVAVLLTSWVAPLFLVRRYA